MEGEMSEIMMVQQDYRPWAFYGNHGSIIKLDIDGIGFSPQRCTVIGVCTMG